MSEDNKSMVGRVNVYLCETCRFATVTIHKDTGTTPFMISCTKPGCGQSAFSTFYGAVTTLAPTHEWYVPDVEETATLKPEVKQHVAMGGLLLRPIITRHRVQSTIDRFEARLAEAKAQAKAGGVPSGDDGLRKEHKP